VSKTILKDIKVCKDLCHKIYSVCTLVSLLSLEFEIEQQPIVDVRYSLFCFSFFFFYSNDNYYL